MKTSIRLSSLEILFIVVATALIGIVIIIPKLAGAKIVGGPNNIDCRFNVRQLIVGITLNAGENNDRFTWEISTNQGGAREFIGTPDVYRFYLALTNELAGPKNLLCPKDERRKKSMASAPMSLALRDNSRLSYFLSMSADRISPNALLVGDRNLVIDDIRHSGKSLFVGSNQLIRWDDDIHENHGNVGFVDGSVQMTSNSEIQSVFQKSGRSYIGLAIP